VIRRVDHLVIAVRNPDAMAASIGAKVGIAFTGGGRHETAGTYNRLAFFRNTYVELIGVFDAALAASASASPVSRAAAVALADGREGLVTWALATDDAVRDVAALQAEGSPIGDVVAGSRVRPDGAVIRWLCAFPDLGPEAPPFLIEHDMTGPEWGPEARERRALFAHPLGARLRFAALELPVRDPIGVADRMRTTVGLAFSGNGEARVGSHGVRLIRGDPARDRPLVELQVVESAPRPDRELVVAGVRWRVRAG